MLSMYRSFSRRIDPPTLIDLMYRQGAVMRGTYIEVTRDQSTLLEFLGELPSALTWLT